MQEVLFMRVMRISSQNGYLKLIQMAGTSSVITNARINRVE